MNRRLVMMVVALIFFISCAGPKPYYQTAEGKRKQKYYNAIQFGQKERPKMKF
jgi:hypothetical protein